MTRLHKANRGVRPGVSRVRRVSIGSRNAAIGKRQAEEPTTDLSGLILYGQA
jgi:hypothetical protein